MTDANNMASDFDQSGSAIQGSANPNDLGGGSAGSPAKGPDYQKQYEELERKFGEQGRELGEAKAEKEEYKNFFDGVAPLLDKLDKSPELVKAIIDGKVDEALAKAAVDGKVTVGEAKIITQAHTEVKRELGKGGYDKATPEDISKLVEEKVSGVRKEMEGKIKEVEDARAFESSVNDFIESKSDFSQYASEIDKWLEKHGEVTDVSVAYFAVKGELSEKEAAKRAEQDLAQREKDLAMNAGGGRGVITGSAENADIIDSLIAPRSNPNLF